MLELNVQKWFSDLAPQKLLANHFMSKAATKECLIEATSKVDTVHPGLVRNMASLSQS